MIRPISDKHLDLLRATARYDSMFKGHMADGTNMAKGKYSLMGDEVGTYDKPLPCFGCGIGWFSFLLGFLCPVMWYYTTILYFGNYYRGDPREHAGLGASAIAGSTGLLCYLVNRSHDSAFLALVVLLPYAPTMSKASDYYSNTVQVYINRTRLKNSAIIGK